MLFTTPPTEATVELIVILRLTESTAGDRRHPPQITSKIFKISARKTGELMMCAAGTGGGTKFSKS